MTEYTQKQIQAVWKKAKEIAGKDPETYRKDPYGHTIMFNKYGKNTPMGWEIHRIVPKEHFDFDVLWNMQAMQRGESAKQLYNHDKKTCYGISARELVQIIVAKKDSLIS